MTRTMKIDFVSDVSCPWCIIGLRGLEEALARTADLVTADVTFQPFELNPQMGSDARTLSSTLPRSTVPRPNSLLPIAP
jgi:predicted DsbA family dithiol-disulfide isomerase